MNDHQNENASRIALYLENKLSWEEREAFKRALGEDDELRIQYVNALMNRAGTGPTFGATVEPVTGTENPDGSGGHVGDTPVSDTFEKEMSVTDGTGEAGMGELEEADRGADVGVHEEIPEEYSEAPARRGFLGSGWMVGVAALLLIIAGVVMFIMIGHGGLWDRTMAATAADSVNANKGNGVDSVAGTVGNRQAEAGKGLDSAVSGAGASSGVAGRKVAFGDSIYARLYKPYMRGDDPVEVREYYQDYRNGNYAAVVAAGDSAVKRPLPRGLLIRDYMRLYVGLSYLATGDGRNAVSELGDVVFRTKPGDVLYETAEWYLALAWLKRTDVEATEAENKALGLAREIAHGYSRYREPAMELVRALKQ
jgi:hypothetical protein